MPRTGWLLLALACAAGAAAGAVPRVPVGVVTRTALDRQPAEDPFPIRRLRGPDSKLPDLLKELEPGPVARLPRPAFEARVRAAGRAVARAKPDVRLVEATYTAALDGGDLTGTAELALLNPGGTAGFVPLDPLKVAVRDATWVGGGPAVVAVPPGAAAPAVWATGVARETLSFRWSLAGTGEPGATRFDLRVPPCPASALELDLPADRAPAAPADVLLTGPFDAPGKPGRRLWRLRFGGRAKLEFAVRAAAPPGAAAAALVARYELSPGQLTAAFEFDLRPARGAAAEWAFLAEPGLRVTDVVANGRAGWTVDSPAAPGGPRRVRVALRQPGPGGKVLVTAVGPPPGDGPLPAVRAAGAILESEALELRLAPGLKVEAWAPGDYHLAELNAPADGPKVLSLTGGLLAPGADAPSRRMPTLRLSAAEGEFTTFERLEWTPGPGASRLVARVRVRAVRGPVFQLVVRPPPGYALDRGAGADELVLHTGGSGPNGQAVALARPLRTGQQAELRFDLRGPGVRPGEPVPFPALAVAGAAERDGWLSVSADPGWAVAAHPGGGAAPAGLWGWLTADAPADARGVYAFRAREPDGHVVLTPARTRVRADASVSLDPPGGRWQATARLALDVTGGALPAVVVFVPGPPAPDRMWRLTAPTGALTAIPVPAALLDLPLVTPFDLPAGCVGARVRSAGADGTVWVLRFARPLTGAVAIETVAPGPPAAATEVTVPVPRVLGAEQQTRAEVADVRRGRATVEVRGDELRVRLGAPAAPRVTDAYLLTAVRAADEVVAAFGGTVRDSLGGALPVGLPPGAELRGVCVAGRWVTPGACAPRDGEVLVPVPAGPAVRFELRYRLAAAPGWPTRPVSSPAPAVPGDPPVSRWWSFADGVRPGWPSRPWAATPDQPPLLGGPLVSGAPAVVIRSDDERVRVGSVRAADATAIGLVALVAVGALLAVRPTRAAVALGAVTVAALTAAELGPPWWARVAWPVLVAALVALARVLAGVTARRAAAPVAAGVLGFAFAPAAVEAVAQPAPATVLLVSTPDGGEEVVTPVALLERLDALARPPRPAPVVTAASYDVRADDAGARVTARFVVHAFGSGDNAVTLPLGDVRLEGVTVDGAAAFPAAPRPDVYTVPVGGPGRHEVEVRFAATVTAAGADRDLKFGAPDAPDAVLTAVLPGGARLPQAVGRTGRQAVGAAGGRTTLAADLGAAKPVHLRWREGTGGAAALTVREGCVWDVSDAGAELTAAYLVDVERGAVGSFRLDVPAELEVLRVAVRAAGAGGAAPALRDWQLGADEGGFRVLRLDFREPAGGPFLAVLECAPRRPVTRQPVLRFPRVAFGPTPGTTTAVYALRAARVAVEEVGRAGVIDFAPDALRDFAAPLDLKLDPNNPVKAYRLVPGAAAELRPVLRPLDPPAVRTATAWAVGPARADATGTVAWTAKTPVPLVEFAAPGVKVLEVRGAEVAWWGQSGGRVQVWLRGGPKEGTFEWTGTAAPAGKGGAFAFDPAPAVAHARETSAEVRVRAADGWAVRPDRVRGWLPLPAPPGELRFRADAPGPPGLRVQVTSTR